MQDGAAVAGHRLTGRTRTSEVGTWSDAVSPEGVPSGVLRLDPRDLAAPGARERLVAAVTADRRLRQSGVTGLMPVADLVAARDEVYLITAARPVPTVADLLAEAGGRLDAGSAATVLVETAQTLLAVHAAGLVHGAVHPGTVVVAEDGSALLAERGLMEALRGERASAERDVAAWAALARGLALSWAGGGAATLLDRAASAATARGLGAARDALLAGREALPPGFTTRERLAQTVQAWGRRAPAGPPADRAPVAGAVPLAAAGEAVTLLDVPGQGPFPGPVYGAADDPARTARQGEDVMMRFGPGVPTETTAAQIWRSGQTASTVHAQQATDGRSPRKRRRRGVGWAGTVLLAMVIALVVLWLRQQPGADLAVSKVDVRAPKKAVHCNGTADFTGVVTTNGEAGTIRYMWIRSDSKERRQLEQHVSSGTKSVSLPLHWDVSGTGSFKGTATLRVLSPAPPSGDPLEDKASFSYKC
ncbi:hypothetical protein Mco01_21120 [Microbispora corallina]|uniref:Serine/threonine protein kinase n=1 Tax=Microbispora corallina TaxID=83302 RepID=A0ABQ4FWD5_9ACTN|nr:hypothetical protein [Microbispora corallina]GIH39112.1 hypothetical protein Mco01_21120 [Microbispora corallina]